ncbi:threonine-phosphate decarboxylase [Alsobacter metallidurans]|uniref:threonine-phosphate decarboxylase n=1 Tax=Alsobacter metallidurans TaxID=340221 RepID=A0A917I4S5_9HYPH|nr:threonine-phosphate decarboxylase [Alsobacter metallidurans]
MAAARARFPDAPQPWIDLSTGINPVAYPVGSISADAWMRLPDSEDTAELERVAADAYGAPDPASVVAAPGAQALIQVLPGLLRPRRVGVLGFTYAEHARCFRRLGADVVTLDSLDEAAASDVVVVVNPNNPDGRLVPPARLLEAGARLASQGGALVVDEAFLDVLDPALSVADNAADAGVIVLRSFGKFYGLAGLRLGFAIAPLRIARALRDALGPWALSGPAIQVGARALADAAWLRDQRRRLAADAARMDALLMGHGFRIVGGTPLFRLAEHDASERLFELLGAQGVLVRPFPQRPAWLRFGLPEPDVWDLLHRRMENAVRSACNQS